MGVRVEICVPQAYPPYCTALLAARFANQAVVAITKHFTEGQSGTFVFLVELTGQDGAQELPAVVKIGPSHLLEQEWRAAQAYIDRKLPGFVPITEKPVALVVPAAHGSMASYSVACYQLAGDGIFAIQTLRDYAVTATATALWTVLEKRLFQQLNRIWSTKAAPVPRSLGATYDRVLPVNLLLDFAEEAMPTAIQLDAAQDPARYPQLQPGDWVQLTNFVVTEIDEAAHTLTLNLAQPAALHPHAYRLRIRNIPDRQAYRVDTSVGRLTGRVVRTRQQLLDAAAQPVLPATIDLTQSLVQNPDSGGEFPNPLVQWSALLQEQMPIRIGTVHGDLNTGNVLVDIAAKTTFIIDCAHARSDHVLYDLVRLESEILLHLVAEDFFRLGLPPTKICELYSWLDYVTQRAPHQPGHFSVPRPLLQVTPKLESAFIALTTIRTCARQYLARPNQWREYYVALTLTLLGSLKFASLAGTTAGTNPKAVAFWGASTLLALLVQPANFIHLDWQSVAVEETTVDDPKGRTNPDVYIDYSDQRRGVFFEGNQSVTLQGNVITGGTVNQTNFHGSVTGPIHTGSGNIHVGGPDRDQPKAQKADDEPPHGSALPIGDPSTSVPRGERSAQRPIKILFLAASPLDVVRVRTDEEARTIDRALRQAEFRIFTIVVHQAVRIDDLQDLLLRHRPDIVHFSGYGTAAHELILQDAKGNAVPVSGTALRRLFTSLKDNIRCIVFNACYTEEQARSLAEVIDCVVGIDHSLTDEASIQFATAFYRALGYGRSVQEAFSLGQGQIELAGLGDATALHLVGAAAAQTRFAGEQPVDARIKNSDDATPQTSGTTRSAPSEQGNHTDIQNAEGAFIHTGSGDMHVDQSRHIALPLFPLPLRSVKSWANDFLRLREADEHARSSWAGMTVYLLGTIMKRISDEGFLTLVLAALTAAFALWFITPMLAWPQPDAQLRLFAAIRFCIAALVLPLLIALLIKPDGTEKFPLHENATQRKLLALKLVGAWTGFGALAGTAIAIAIIWFHLWGFPLPLAGRWFLALCPPFFAYISARRMPLDRYKMFQGELRLHDADPLFLTVFALFGPVLAGVVYSGHWFLSNQAAMLSVVLGFIGLSVWQIHQRDKNRFPDLLMIAILGLLLPLGFLLLFFFDMRPSGSPPTFVAGEVGIFAVLSVYVLGITLLLATVGVRQCTHLTLHGVLSLMVVVLVILGVSAFNLWAGRILILSLIFLWYTWGRRQFRQRKWLWVHPTIDWLLATLIGVAVVGIYTTTPLWANATLFGLLASVLVLWAYRAAPMAVVVDATESTVAVRVNDEPKAKSISNLHLWVIITIFVMMGSVAAFWVGGRLADLQPAQVQSFAISAWSLQSTVPATQANSSISALTHTLTDTLTDTLTEGTRSALYEKLALVDELDGYGRLDPALVERGTIQPDYWIEGTSRQRADTEMVELTASIARGNGEFVGMVTVAGPLDETAEACILILQQQLAVAILEKLAIVPVAETVEQMKQTPTTDCRALALNNQAAAELAAGSPDAAIYKLEAALQIDPTYGDAYNNMGRGFYLRKEFATAIEFAQKAVKEQPHNPFYNYNLGLAYERSGDYAKAIAAYETALDAEMLYVNALNNLGFTLLLMGNITDARLPIEKGLALDGTLPALHKNLGRILLAQAQPAAAATALQAAITHSRAVAYPEALFYLAVAQQEINDSAAACRTLHDYRAHVTQDIPERVNAVEKFFFEWQCEELAVK